jgi:glycogen synthase
MRILFISNLYPPYDLGGHEQICQEVVERFKKRGHVCHILTSNWGVDRFETLVEDGLTRSLYLQSDIYYYKLFDFFIRRPWREYSNKKELKKAINDFQPDVIFVWGMWNLSPRVACWAEQLMPGRVVYNIQSYWPKNIDPHTAYWNKLSNNPITRISIWPVSLLAKGILKLEKYPPRPQFENVSCCSQHIVDDLTKSGSIPYGATVILNGIDPAPFLAHARSEDKSYDVPRLLYFGSLMEQKGVHTAIEALGLLRQERQTDKLHLTIVGGGQPDYEQHLRILAKDVKVESQVDFVGRVPRSAIPEILQHHDIFLFTSIWAEPFGRTIIEAMAAGLTVIGADVGGSREIFCHYPEDTLFSPGNAQELASQIQHFLENPKTIRSLGRAGQELVQKQFTLECMVNKMESWIKEVALSE